MNFYPNNASQTQKLPLEALQRLADVHTCNFDMIPFDGAKLYVHCSAVHFHVNFVYQHHDRFNNTVNYTLAECSLVPLYVYILDGARSMKPVLRLKNNTE